MISRREFFKYSAVAGAAAVAGAGLAGCGESRGAQSSASASAASSSTEASTSSSTASLNAPSVSQADSIVVYFSHAGENYGVGYVEEGNTAIVAGMIAEQTGADTFEIVPAEAYPEGYDECCDVAQDELRAGARPAYVDDVDLSAYKTVYFGYPIWWGDLPMCAYTFVEAHDWAGKEIHPFCTHAGSGLANTVSALQSACAGATVGEGLSVSGVTAQNSRSEAQAAVDAWL